METPSCYNDNVNNNNKNNNNKPQKTFINSLIREFGIDLRDKDTINRRNIQLGAMKNTTLY